MANQEAEIRRALADGDRSKVREAYKAYDKSMTSRGQNPKPLSYFEN